MIYMTDSDDTPTINCRLIEVILREWTAVASSGLE